MQPEQDYVRKKNPQRGGLIRVAVADPYPAVLAGLRVLLPGDSRLCIVGETLELTRWAEQRSQWAADVVLVGHSLADLARETMQCGRIEDSRGGACVLMSEQEGPEVVARAFGLGCRGIFYKRDEPQDLLAAIVAVHHGRLWCREGDVPSPTDTQAGRAVDPPWKVDGGLTERQQLVSKLVVRGLSNGQISNYVRVSEATVASDLTHIYRTLGVSDRVNLIVKLNG